MLGTYLLQDLLGEFGRGDSIAGWNDYGLFGEAVYDNENGGIAGRWWKLFYEVHE